MVRIATPQRQAPSSRLVSLGIALLLTCVLMALARQPDTWRRLGFAPPLATPSDAGRDPPDHDPMDVANAVPNARAAVALPSPTLPAPLIPVERLRAVRDETMHVTDDPASWFEVWSELRDATPAELAPYDAGRIAYAQLVHQPDVYRGHIVTLAGTARRATWIAAGPEGEPHGIRGYWQLWVDPDFGPRSPWVVYCLSLPEGFPQADSIAAPVSCQALFYKRWAYAAQDGVRTAPLLMAAAVAWHPPSVAESSRAPASTAQWVFVVAGALAAAVGIAVAAAASTRSSPRRRKSTTDRIREPADGDKGGGG